MGPGFPRGHPENVPDLAFSDSRSTLYIYQKQLFVYCKQVSFMLRALKVLIMFKKKKKGKGKRKVRSGGPDATFPDGRNADASLGLLPFKLATRAPAPRRPTAPFVAPDTGPGSSRRSSSLLHHCFLHIPVKKLRMLSPPRF